MTSLPSQAPRRRSSQPEQTPSSPARETSSELPSTSQDLEYVHLNNPEPATTDTEADPSSPSQTLALPTPEPKRCWICQLDSTEDDENSVWRKPCPCSLEAHNDCLLQWVAAEETPKKGALSTTKKLACPQCGTEIKIRRPRDIIVSAAELATRISRRLIIPTGIASVLGSTYSGLWLYGWGSMNLVFGVEETQSMLGYAVNQASTRDLDWWTKPLAIFNPLYLNRWLSGPLKSNKWLLYLGLPSIAPTLILLRTKFPDQFLSISVPIYFISAPNRQLTWPPRPGLAFALIPYLKTAYNGLYAVAFAELEKKWDLAVQRQPREGETAEQIAAQAAGEGEENGGPNEPEINVGEDNVLFDIQIAVDVPGPIADGAGPDLANADPNDPHHNHNHAHQWNIEENISGSDIGSTLMGALLFPAVSSAMGNLLKHTLPNSWVLPTRLARNKGLLQEKWGRSLVGGCLFVVLKDMVLLYCKWKKARDFGKREILDYVVPKEKRRRRLGEGNTLWNGFLARGR